MTEFNFDYIKNLEIFAGLDEEFLLKLYTLGKVKKFNRNTHVFLDKDMVNNIFIVLKGKFSLYKLSENAQKKVVFILGEGKILNEVILDDLPASICCETFEDGYLLVYDKKTFIDLMEENFAFTKNVINSLAKKVRRLYRQMKNTTPIKIEKKLAAKLWKLSKDYGVSHPLGTLINLNVSVTYLADMFGSQRETISRALKRLQELDLIIVESKKFYIPDRNKLSDYFKDI
ncbi:Crp/Fnr family transcriptional regulator [Clostridium sp. YIM B02505]|uniref:Crp/Fnr family transcriptional regulator n=1 Tax=Clostridium yunnanense TaxID=2800325 RepID=A0ABS1EVW5_9CLOT|nr:Crp/Fnr family transcriptional regulator [Clostridium yunnanense]MBK1813533.1 Crp/Fnr family transcriptional regulator [Clostridium yunnanense]